MDWYEAAIAYWLNTPDGAGLESLPSEWQRELVARIRSRAENGNRVGLHRMKSGSCGAILAEGGTQGNAAGQEAVTPSE